MRVVYWLVGRGDHVLPWFLRVAGWRSRWVQTSRGPIHCFEVAGKGDGPPFVLVHGLGSRAADYSILVRRLARFSRRILIPDLPGHGWSPNDDPDPDDLRAILAEAIEELLPEEVHLVGNSMGGLVAVRLALAAPERVLSLVLLSPAGAPMRPDQVEAVRGLFGLSTMGEALGFVDRLLAVRVWTRWLMALGLPARLGRPAVQAILRRLHDVEYLTPDEVQSLPMPVLLFWGAGDRILDGDQLDWYRAHLPRRAVVVTPEGFGHSPFFDQPGAFVRALRRFLDEVESGSGPGAPRALLAPTGDREGPG